MESVPPNKNFFSLNHTQRQSLDAIRRNGELSRAQIAKICGISPPSVTTMVRGLFEKELVKETGKADNPRGQPATNLSLNPEGGYSLGVFIERDAIHLNAINFCGKVIGEVSLLGTFDNPANCLTLIFSTLDEFIAEKVANPDRIVGLGLAVSGNFVEDRATIAPPADMVNWRGLNFSHLFRERFEFPVIVENDGATAALGELLTGQGENYRTFFHIYLGNGLGGGYLLDGKLMRGGYGNAAELGHLIRSPKKRPTLRNLAESLNRPQGDISSKEIRSLFNARNPCFMNWLDEAVDNLSSAVNALSILMDPQAIVIGGRFPSIVTKYIIRKLRIESYGEIFSLVKRPVIIPAKTLGADAVTYGAAALPLYKFLLISSTDT